MLRESDWQELLKVLKVKGPMDDYEIIGLAAERIKYLEQALQTEHDDCVRIAKEVLPDVHMYFAHQAAWSMNTEIRRLRDEIARKAPYRLLFNPENE
jgi:hypothetical protein